MPSDTLSKSADKEVAKSPKEQEKEAKRALKLAERKAKERARSAKFEAKHAAELTEWRAKKQADSVAKALRIAWVDSLKKDSLSRVTLTLDSIRLADSLALAERPVDSLVRRMHAYRNVKVFRKDLQAVCDSLVGFSIDSTLHMYTAPVLWSESNQVMSERVHMYTKDQQLKRAVFEGDPIMASEVDTLHYNQIKGKVMEAYFTDGAITRMDANGNGQTYYYLLENEGTPEAYISGFMTVECADISFYFENNTIDRMAWKAAPAFAFYPMEKLPEAQLMVMKGFVWEAKRRPSLEQVFTRTIRPSQRAVYEALEKPIYPLTEKINQERERLVKSGLWFDRQERLSPDAQEFVTSLSN